MLQPHVLVPHRLQASTACCSSEHPVDAATAAAPADERACGAPASAEGPAASLPLPQLLQRMRQACGLQIPAGCEVCQDGSGQYLGLPIRWRSCIQVSTWSTLARHFTGGHDTSQLKRCSCPDVTRADHCIDGHALRHGGTDDSAKIGFLIGFGLDFRHHNSAQASGAFHEEYASDDMVHRGGYDGISHEAWEVGAAYAPLLMEMFCANLTMPAWPVEAAARNALVFVDFFRHLIGHHGCAICCCYGCELRECDVCFVVHMCMQVCCRSMALWWCSTRFQSMPRLRRYSCSAPEHAGPFILHLVARRWSTAGWCGRRSWTTLRRRC